MTTSSPRPSVRTAPCRFCREDFTQTLGTDGYYHPLTCSEKCDAAIEEKGRELAAGFTERAKDHQLKNLIADSNVPDEFWSGRITLDALPRIYADMRPAGGVDVPRYTEVVQIIAAYVDNEKNGGIVFLYGDKGTGKSWLLQAAVAHAIRKHLRPATYATPDDILETIKMAMDRDKELTEGEAVARFTGPALLAFDDLGRGKQLTRWELGMMLRVVDERVRFNRPILAASNFDLNSLSAVWGAGGEAELHNAKLICDRLADVKKALHISMTGRSLRKEK